MALHLPHFLSAENYLISKLHILNESQVSGAADISVYFLFFRSTPHYCASVDHDVPCQAHDHEYS